jgi:hypothetical protein
MANFPVPVSKDELLAVLDDIRERVLHDDSFEGTVSYSLPEPGDAPEMQFRLRAAYRVGNLAGQGGMRLIGSMKPDLPSEEEARAALD